MKKCPYCGAEYPDDAVMCIVDRTPFERPGEPLSPPPPPHEPRGPEYDFAPLSVEDRRKDLVTLLTCRTLAEADLVASRLRAAGIAVSLPDENVTQTFGVAVNTFGNVRVQISPNDYDAARDLLGGN